MIVHPRRIKLQVMQMASHACPPNCKIKGNYRSIMWIVEQVRVIAIPLDLNMCFGNGV
jgi:hypothetical protein